MMFDKYLLKWNLVPDGEQIKTASSYLLPVIYAGKKAMLKMAFEEEERFGGLLLNWWGGDSAVKVYEQDDDALLLERATGIKSLAKMAANGHDEEATRIICNTIKRLHKPRPKPLPNLVSLKQWFTALTSGADKYGGLIKQAALTAEKLLADPKQEKVLHGDIHHENVLDSERGWLVIDPKRLYGERTFEYANLFCNPNKTIACRHEIFKRRAIIVCELGKIEYNYLMQWILAWAALSAVWCMEDRITPIIDLSVAEMAMAECDLSAKKSP